LILLNIWKVNDFLLEWFLVHSGHGDGQDDDSGNEYQSSNTAEDDDQYVLGEDCSVYSIDKVLCIFIGDNEFSSEVGDWIVSVVLDESVESVDLVWRWWKVDRQLEAGLDVEGKTSDGFDVPSELVIHWIDDDSIEFVVGNGRVGEVEMRKGEDNVDSEPSPEIEETSCWVIELDTLD